MLQLVLFLSLIAASTASCNRTVRTCGSTTVPYPFGFSPSCKIQLSCNTSTFRISLSGFPLQNITNNNTFLLNVSANCSRPIASASVFFSNSYALTYRNRLLLRGCPAPSSPCVLTTEVVSQLSHQLTPSACRKGDNLTCFFNDTGNMYLTKDYELLNKSSCGTSGDLFTSVLYGKNEEQTVLALGIVEIGWWMTGPCRCAANASCQRANASEVKDGYWCKCDEGLMGDGFAEGDGCHTYRGSKSNSAVRIATFVIVVVLVVASLAVTGLCFWRKNWSLHIDKNNDDDDQIMTVNENVETELQYILNPNAEYQLFNFITLKIATENFSDMNKLGKGGFGPVYKGILPGGKEIAVKRLSGCSTQGLTEFKNEVDFLAKLKHKNLVELLGCCIHKKEKLLCYEYLPNGSLDKILFARDASKTVKLGWQMRHKIIDGITRGLHYLHEESRLKIIHRDLKVSNILLDKGMNPKISDFGLARFFEEDQTHIDTNIIAGTFGYMAPEYVLHGNFSAKSDVYSFGVLLLEIVTGQKNSSFSGSNRISNLIDHALMHWNSGTIFELKDPMLEEEFDEEIKRCVHIALLWRL